MAALRNGSKCSHTTCMLRFFTVSRLALNSNLIFEIGSNKMSHKHLIFQFFSVERHWQGKHNMWMSLVFLLFF